MIDLFPSFSPVPPAPTAAAPTSRDASSVDYVGRLLIKATLWCLGPWRLPLPKQRSFCQPLTASLVPHSVFLWIKSLITPTHLHPKLSPRGRAGNARRHELQRGGRESIWGRAEKCGGQHGQGLAGGSD